MQTLRLLLFIGFLPLVTLWLWVLREQDTIIELSFLNALHQVSGWISLSLFTLSLITATRLGFLEKIFTGFDQLYQFHKYIGITAFLLLWLHADTILVQNLDNLPRYLFPSTSFEWYSLGLSLGIVAFYVITLQLLLTYIKRVPYHIWKVTHEFLSIAVIIGGLHIILIQVSRGQNNDPLTIWALILTIIAAIAAVYTRFLWKWFPRYYPHIIGKIEPNAVGVNLYLTPTDKILNFTPGQLVFVSFLDNSISAEVHPYSISSAPSDPYLRLSIKALGDHTRTLANNLTRGSAVSLNGPYGAFGDPFYAHTGKKTIFVAGGIGITPFLSMTRDATAKKIQKSIDLWYLARNPTDAIFSHELQQLSTQNANLTIIQKYSDTDGFTTPQALANHYNDVLKTYDIFLCGPKLMMDLFVNDLVKMGIAKRNIYMEDFSLK